MDFPQEHKEYIKVRVDCMPDGRIVPLMFKTEAGEKMIIDKILDVRQAPALKKGGQGMRYTCRIGQTVIYLFHDREYWFLEEI